MHNLEVKSLQKKLVIISNILLLTSGFIFLLSLSTVFWSKASSTSIKTSYVNFSSKSTSPDLRPFLMSQGNFSIANFKYSYKAKGNIYKSDILCFCLPIGLIPEKEQTARYLPFAPKISVLFTGPHLALPLIFFILGYGIRIMHYKLLAFIEQNN